MSQETQRSLADILTTPADKSQEWTVPVKTPMTVGTSSESKRNITTEVISSPALLTNSIDPTWRNPEPRDGEAPQGVAWKAEELKDRSEVGEYTYTGDISLIVRTEFTQDLKEAMERLGQFSSHQKIVESDGTQYLEVEMFKLDRTVKHDSFGNPTDDQSQVNYALALEKCSVLYNRPFKAVWHFGAGLRSNSTDKGVAIGLEAEVDFAEGISPEDVSASFEASKSTSLYRDSSKVDLYARSAEKEITLKHLASSEPGTKISYKHLKNLVIGNAVPQAVLGEMALYLEFEEDFRKELPLSILQTEAEPNIMESSEADWILVFPALAYFEENSETNIEPATVLDPHQKQRRAV